MQKNGKFVWKNGKLLYCKHLVDKDKGKINARHIGDEDLKSHFVDSINKNYILADTPAKESGREHPSFSNEHSTIQNVEDCKM